MPTALPCRAASRPPEAARAASAAAPTAPFSWGPGPWPPGRPPPPHRRVLRAFPVQPLDLPVRLRASLPRLRALRRACTGGRLRAPERLEVRERRELGLQLPPPLSHALRRRLPLLARPLQAGELQV